MSEAHAGTTSFRAPEDDTTANTAMLFIADIGKCYSRGMCRPCVTVVGGREPFCLQDAKMSLYVYQSSCEKCSRALLCQQTSNDVSREKCIINATVAV